MNNRMTIKSELSVVGQRTSGFTIIELLVVIAIIGILVGLTLPAVQAAREAARRMQCRNNLKQLGLAMHNHHAAHNAFPTAVSGSGVIHYWGAQLLPFIEQNAMTELYRYNVRFDGIENKEAVQFPLPYMHCPSTPTTPVADPRFKLATTANPVGWGSLGSDYAASSGPLSSMWRNPPAISYAGYPKPGDISGFFEASTRPGQKGRRDRDILDGLTNSIMFVESSGRPEVWQKGKGLVPGSGQLTSNPATRYVVASSWAAGNIFAVRGYRIDQSVADPFNRWQSPGPCMINCTNAYSIYSFHPAGANVVVGDGSVHFLSENVDTDLVLQMLTVNGHEVVTDF
jgi:prepilin-type N-terminal cleavage/methylation domain-containing protein